MAAKNRPYEQYGSYILFKKLETDSLSELWRAAKIEGNQLGSLVALRRLTGGSRDALVTAAQTAAAVAPLLSGSSFARSQVIDVAGGVPFIAHDYAGGRSLRHIVDRARGGNGNSPNPIPIDQAIVIAEKVALSLATTSDLRYQGNRLNHGALIPQFVWISDDGEIRVAGQQLGAGLVASLHDPKVGGDLGRYFAPEYRTSGTPSKPSEVFSMGALLYLLVTGQEPPDATTASAFANTVLAAKAFAGTPLPDDIKALLHKSLVLDPAARYASIADMKAALSALAHGGKYSATTFNLAFYLSNLLKKEMEAEVLDREKESKLNVTPYLDVPVAAAAAPAISTPTFGLPDEEPKAKSKLPMAIAAAGALIAIGVGAWLTLGSKKPAPTATLASAAAPVPPRPQVAIEPIVATTTSPETATGTVDAEAERKKAFEEAVKKQLQDEMMKLQTEYTRSLQQQQSKNAPVPIASTPSPAREESAPSAAALDAQRRETAAPQPTATQAPAPAPAVAQSQPAPAPAAPAPAPVSQVREGDVVEVTNVDTVPRAVKPIRPVYPPLAARQKIEGTVIVSALVSETGEVLDVKVLRGDGRFGLDEAAVRAVRLARYSPAMKDGKRVKTWMPQTIIFKQ